MSISHDLTSAHSMSQRSPKSEERTSANAIACLRHTRVLTVEGQPTLVSSSATKRPSGDELTTAARQGEKTSGG
jgi:hypothetical protein